MKPEILVVGSSNTDLVIQADHLPAAGETILGGQFFTNPGGKGANQAVASVRLGGRVRFIAKTGNDLFGQEAVRHFREEGIDTSHLFLDEKHPSGVALITVDRHAENCIVVASGANAALSADDLRSAKAIIENAAIVLLQLEIPLETVQYVIETAAAKNIRVVLNPAPARPLPAGLLQHVNIITPNEKEAAMLSGVNVTGPESAKEAARAIRHLGVETVIITLGSQGALLFHDQQFILVPGFPVDAVDSTAAGDVFNGALVVALAEGSSLPEATGFACAAAALSVTRRGAQSSAPYKTEVDAFIDAHDHNKS